jgi:hypothetical protein
LISTTKVNPPPPGAFPLPPGASPIITVQSKDIPIGQIIQLWKLGSPITAQKLYKSILKKNKILKKELAKCTFASEIEAFIISELDLIIINNGGAQNVRNFFYIFFTYIEQVVAGIYGATIPPDPFINDPSDIVKTTFRNSASFLIRIAAIDMDIYLLARLFGPRTVNPNKPSKCYTSITYSGSVHTELYKKFFDFLITRGIPGLHRGSFENPNKDTEGCVDITGFSANRTDSDLF